MKFKVIIKKGPEVVAQVEGREVNPEHVTVADVDAVIPTEQLLERLTGFRFHIETTA